MNHIVNILWIKNYLMYDSKFNTIFLILTIITGLISLSDQLSENEMQVYGEKKIIKTPMISTLKYTLIILFKIPQNMEKKIIKTKLILRLAV